ncbi:MAG: hypothetical protein B6U75_02790 [Desulfurococcales archaeon ex4484_217_1]|nr:MAG: hypothetical protein B6U75_02790 [Desulfurococcales archaeon ex4484_217_1]
MVKTIISLTHGTDLDGIASAAIIYRYSKLKNYTCELHFAEPYNLNEKLKSLTILNKRYGEVIIADLGVNRKVYAEVLESLRKLKEKGIVIKWFDHHVWGVDISENVKEIVDVFENDTRFCAAELVQTHLLPKDSIARRIALLARDIDFWLRRLDLSVKLSKIIKSNKVSKKQIVEKLSEGIFWNDYFQKIYEELRVVEKRLINKALRNIETHNIEGFKVALVKNNVPAGLIADVLAEKGFDIIVVLSYTGKISLRRGKNDINLLPIAEKLGGGGHPYAAGAILDYGVIDKFLAKHLRIYRKKDKILKAIKETVSNIRRKQ